MTAAKLRQASFDEVVLMLGWAAEEGWNPGLDDAAPFHAADPEGFFVAEVDAVPVAAISVVNHSDSIAFLGLYICRPEFRGQGIGFALWRHALDHAGERTVGLDGVAAQQDNYARSGFRPSGATIRHEGVIPPAGDPHIREAQIADLAGLERLDREANGFSRLPFLSAWVADAGTRRTVVLETPTGLGGFATIRRCGDGSKIGPVVAPDAASALALCRAAVARCPTSRAIIDIPSGNTDLIARFAQLGFQQTFATARMYRGAEPATGPGLQAIATMELG